MAYARIHSPRAFLALALLLLLAACSADDPAIPVVGTHTVSVTVSGLRTSYDGWEISVDRSMGAPSFLARKSA